MITLLPNCLIAYYVANKLHCFSQTPTCSFFFNLMQSLFTSQGNFTLTLPGSVIYSPAPPPLKIDNEHGTSQRVKRSVQGECEWWLKKAARRMEGKLKILRTAAVKRPDILKKSVNSITTVWRLTEFTTEHVGFLRTFVDYGWRPLYENPFEEIPLAGLRSFFTDQCSLRVAPGAPSTLRWWNLKTQVSLLKRIKRFPSTLRRRNLKTQQSWIILICVWRLGHGNHMINVTPSFSKSSVFQMFSVHSKTQRRRFQIPPVSKAFSKSSVFVTD